MKFIKIHCHILLILISLPLISPLKQWPKVENVKKSAYLPSLEVKVNPPDWFQPKIQAFIAQLDEKREKNERKLLKDWEETYNAELYSASKEIMNIIKSSLSLFNDDNLLKKSIEFAITPPLVWLSVNAKTKCNLKELLNMPGGTNDKQEPKATNNNISPENISAMRRIENINKVKDTYNYLNDIQKDVEGRIKLEMNTQDKNSNWGESNIPCINGKCEKHGNDQLSTSLSDQGFLRGRTGQQDRLNNRSTFDNKVQFIQKDTFIPLQNGPITPKELERWKSDHFQSASFIELSSKTQTNTATEHTEGTYTKPISVEMKMPSEPDPSIKTKISEIENNREKLEMNMAKKAINEFKLITKITIKELKYHLKQELLPFYVLSKGTMREIDNIITENIKTADRKSNTNQMNFMQIDKDELSAEYGEILKNNKIDFENKVQLNTAIYNGLLKFFTGLDLDSMDPAMWREWNGGWNEGNSETDWKRLVRTSKKMNDDSVEDCLELRRKFPNWGIECDDIKRSLVYSSFVETGASGGGEDFINVKFAAADQSYPTIEKLVSQMMTRRDLAEKYIRLKIWEYETRLQKAENEMIQDTWHEYLYRIISKYAPAIEGMQEHIK